MDRCAPTAWTQAFHAADPVTLALYCGAHDPEALAEQIMVRLAEAGLDPQLLPDLMLCRPEIQLQDLVAAAVVVLVDESQRSRPELVRRALRVVAPDPASLLGLRAELISDAPSRCAAKAA